MPAESEAHYGTSIADQILYMSSIAERIQREQGVYKPAPEIRSRWHKQRDKEVAERRAKEGTPKRPKLSDAERKIKKKAYDALRSDSGRNKGTRIKEYVLENKGQTRKVSGLHGFPFSQFELGEEVWVDPATLDRGKKFRMRPKGEQRFSKVWMERGGKPYIVVRREA